MIASLALVSLLAVSQQGGTMSATVAAALAEQEAADRVERERLRKLEAEYEQISGDDKAIGAGTDHVRPQRDTTSLGLQLVKMVYSE